MNSEDRKLKMVKEFTNHIKKTSPLEYVWIAVLVALVAFGFVAFIYTELKGHIVTGMRDNVVWGIYISNFIFFMGLGYAGAIISGTLRLLRVKWRSSLMRIIELTTLISVLIGPIYILLCIGRLDRLHYLLIHGRIQSPITWDVLAVITFIVASLIFLYLAVIRDFAILRDFKGIDSKWRNKLYKVLSLNYKDTPKQHKSINTSLDIMAALIIPISILLSTILSWIFGMTLRPGWNSTIFGPYFVFASLYSGTALLIMIMYILRKFHGLEYYITKTHFEHMGTLLLILAALYGYFTFNEYFTIWYSFEKWDSELLVKLFDYDQYFPQFIFANFIGILLPILIIGIPWLRTIRITLAPTGVTIVEKRKGRSAINGIFFSAVIVVAALWVKRYLIVIPTLETPLLPIDDLRPEYAKYTMTWVEWALTIAGPAMFCLLFTLAARFFPMIPIRDFEEEDKKIEEPKLQTQGAKA
jgi:molybdopterin-containing oxidoreductase family membrane subunit